MSKREAFHNDDSSRRLPMYPPGLRRNYGSNGVWDGELDQSKFFNKLAATALDLYDSAPLSTVKDGLERLRTIGQLRSMLEAAEANIMADSFEMYTREATNQGTQEALIDQQDVQDAHFSASCYGVNFSDDVTIRSSFVAEASVALRDTVGRVSAKLFTAEGLRNVCTNTLTALSNGEITTKAAREIVRQSQDLDPSDIKQLEYVLIPLAKTATDSVVSQRARRMHERLHPKPIEDRHKEARAGRAITWWKDVDGMATLQAYLPAEDVISIINTVNWFAAHEEVEEEDQRTERQRRADLFRDVILDGWPETSGTPLKSRIAVTIPAIEMLTNPKRGLAELEGYGPIPMEVALKIAKDAPSILRVLTDPWTGAVIDVARNKYRPSKALRDLLRWRDIQCRFPGCNKLAEESEADHIDGWAKGGHTSRTNTQLLCKRHQLFKHALGWEVIYKPDGSVQWRTPHGMVCLEVPGSVSTVENFDFARNPTPTLPVVEMTARLRHVLGWHDDEPEERAS
ncbi:DUF222 domain-containing protein [Glutamicibacter sp.]|uniref:HNH endonuclease signature motif containing protein n=1 Tax=Glutamicibacter sp. TaxID=1931995 RepID=UPI0028BE22C8|nr:DUF222 domain-containing protein [Glutamicibacter sp.]